MPADHGIGLHDQQRFPPLVPPLGEQHPKRAIRGPEARPPRVSLENGELVTKREILDREGSSRSERGEQSSKEDEDHANEPMRQGRLTGC